MKNMTLENIVKACHGQLFIPEGYNTEEAKQTEASSVCIDSRIVTENGIFIATVGARVDGHTFIEQVWEKGVLAVICEKEPENKKGIYILVKDSFTALKEVATFYMAQLNIPAVGIIGSMGKTSTKELVSSVLAIKYNVYKTSGNFNNEVGVPLTILGIPNDAEIAVIEMGINHFGEMDRLGAIVKPDSVVMTNIGPCHLEFLGDLDGVLKAKSEVFAHMQTGNGRAILNGDDAKLTGINEVNGKAPLFFGRDEKCDVYATNIVSHGIEGTEARINYGKEYIDVMIPLPGVHMVNNSLAATAVGLTYGMTLDEIKEGIESAKGVSGRCNLIKTDKYLVVDDCYNANPNSMKAAIDLLTNANSRKVAILGDMFEMGDKSKELHESVGEYVAKNKIDLIITAGEDSKYMYDAAVSNNINSDIRYYKNTEELIKELSKGELLNIGDSILIKASHGMEYSKIVKLLTE